jgi:hypothetical protein
MQNAVSYNKSDRFNEKQKIYIYRIYIYHAADKY